MFPVHQDIALATDASDNVMEDVVFRSFAVVMTVVLEELLVRRYVEIAVFVEKRTHETFLFHCEFMGAFGAALAGFFQVCQQHRQLQKLPVPSKQGAWH